MITSLAILASFILGALARPYVTAAYGTILLRAFDEEKVIEAKIAAIKEKAKADVAALKEKIRSKL